jgi:predicted membrane-bound spermidine synthase
MVQAGVGLYAVGILLLILWLHRGIFPPFLSRPMEGIFPFLTLVAGFLGGVHFPLASAVYLREREQIGRIGGLINGVDLVGSAAGALIISVILVPLMGIAQVVFVIVVLNLSAIFGLGTGALRERKG